MIRRKTLKAAVWLGVGLALATCQESKESPPDAPADVAADSGPGADDGAAADDATTVPADSGAQDVASGTADVPVGQDAGPDAAVAVDSGQFDGVAADDVAADSGVADSGVADGGVADGGVADSGPGDSGAGDSGAGDSSLADSGAGSGDGAAADAAADGASPGTDVAASGDGDGCKFPAVACPGAAMPAWKLEDKHPKSGGFKTTYGLEKFVGKVTVLALLSGW